ncbi:hypothetical protein SESBI_03305 [Sesbania bispinosa]|nr:hypothetical protein SESBI_03305 [Sesbania bispinosa]
MDPNPTTTFNEKHEQNNRIDGEAYVGLAVHSRVIKIKQEIEKIKQPSLELHMRRVLLRDVKRLRSRSPLGLAERAILVGHS